MTFPDRRLDRPLEPPEARSENAQDVIPPHERSQDPERSTHDLARESARPLTDEERKAADRDVPVSERVYAPASERVPRQPQPGHRDFMEHPDGATPERQAAASVGSATTYAMHEEPSFTRVPRPSMNPGSAGEMPAEPQRWMSSSPAIGSMLVPMGIGWAAVGIGSGVAIWMWMRWRRERNRPINRIRREAKHRAWQARQTASELRERVPDLPDDATRPAMGLGTALVSLAILVWQSQARSRPRMSTDEARRRARKASQDAMKAGQHAKRAAETLSDIDWQQRLEILKELWSPARIELEKRSIPRR